MTRTSTKAEFPGATGAPLAALLELPDGAPRGYAVFAHCFTCGMDNVAAPRISRALTGRVQAAAQEGLPLVVPA